MESARKVALVPQQLLSTLMAQQQLNPGLAQLSKIDTGMQNVLENSNLPSDIKHIQYNQMMHNYQTMRDQEFNKPMAINVKSDGSGSQLTIPDDDIIGGMPKNYRNKAKILLSHVKRAQNIGVDDKGQVIIDGKLINNSNITDLIFDYAKPNKRNQPPAKGWREFGKALKQTNAPREGIVNAARWNELDRPFLAIQEPLASPLDFEQVIQEEEDETFVTPKAKKRKTPSPAAARSPAVRALRRGSRERKPTKVFSPVATTSWRSYNQKK